MVSSYQQLHVSAFLEAIIMLYHLMMASRKAETCSCW